MFVMLMSQFHQSRTCTQSTIINTVFYPMIAEGFRDPYDPTQIEGGMDNG